MCDKCVNSIDVTKMANSRNNHETIVHFDPSDPRQWTENHVAEWLTWTVNEFSLKDVKFEKFCMNGASLCAMGKERFLDLAPDFVGDILWEHLEMLQKGEVMCIMFLVFIL